MNMYCLPINIAAIITDAVLLKLFLEGVGDPRILILLFAGVTIFSQIIYFIHRGVRPIAGPIAITAFIIAALLLRYSLGNFITLKPVVEYLMGSVIALLLIKFPIS